jgi:hypothetical protein
LEKLRGPTNPAQRILDLVSEISHQFAVGLRGIDQALFAINPPAFVLLTELKQKCRGPSILPAGHRPERKRLARRTFEQEIDPLLLISAVDRFAKQCLDQMPVGKHSMKGLTNHHAAGNVKK